MNTVPSYFSPLTQVFNQCAENIRVQVNHWLPGSLDERVSDVKERTLAASGEASTLKHRAISSTMSSMNTTTKIVAIIAILTLSSPVAAADNIFFNEERPQSPLRQVEPLKLGACDHSIRKIQEQFQSTTLFCSTFESAENPISCDFEGLQLRVSVDQHCQALVDIRSRTENESLLLHTLLLYQQWTRNIVDPIEMVEKGETQRTLTFDPEDSQITESLIEIGRNSANLPELLDSYARGITTASPVCSDLASKQANLGPVTRGFIQLSGVCNYEVTKEAVDFLASRYLLQGEGRLHTSVFQYIHPDLSSASSIVKLLSLSFPLPEDQLVQAIVSLNDEEKSELWRGLRNVKRRKICPSHPNKNAWRDQYHCLDESARRKMLDHLPAPLMVRIYLNMMGSSTSTESVLELSIRASMKEADINLDIPPELVYYRFKKDFSKTLAIGGCPGRGDSCVHQPFELLDLAVNNTKAKELLNRCFDEFVIEFGSTEFFRSSLIHEFEPPWYLWYLELEKRGHFLADDAYVSSRLSLDENFTMRLRKIIGIKEQFELINIINWDQSDIARAKNILIKHEEIPKKKPNNALLAFRLLESGGLSALKDIPLWEAEGAFFKLVEIVNRYYQSRHYFKWGHIFDTAFEDVNGQPVLETLLNSFLRSILAQTTFQDDYSDGLRVLYSELKKKKLGQEFRTALALKSLQYLPREEKYSPVLDLFSEPDSAAIREERVKELINDQSFTGWLELAIWTAEDIKISETTAFSVTRRYYGYHNHQFNDISRRYADFRNVLAIHQPALMKEVIELEQRLDVGKHA
jgi:hypothetical protein